MIIGLDEIEKYLMRKYPNKGYCILRSIRVVGCFVDRLLTLFKVNCCYTSKRVDSLCFYHVSLYIHCHVYIYIYCNYILIETLCE